LIKYGNNSFRHSDFKGIAQGSKGSFQFDFGDNCTLQSIATGNEMARPTGSLPTAQYQQKNIADVQSKGHSWGNTNQSEDLFQIVRSGVTYAGRATIKKAKEMKQIGNSNEDMLALLEAVVGNKNELLYIREYFHPLLKGEIYLSGEQVCEMLHISKRTLQQYRDDGLIPFIKLERKILFRESDIVKVLEDNYQR